MTFQEEQEFKVLKAENKKLRKENEEKQRQISILRRQDRENKETINEFDKYNYRSECLNLREENQMLKKKVENLMLTLEQFKNSSNKNSSNSLKPSSTDGFKHVIQNNRIKTENRPGRKKGYIAPSPKYIENPSETIQVPNNNLDVCCCGGELVNKELVKRQVIGIEINPIVKEYRGHIAKCKCCGKEYSPNFPNGVNNPINYDNSIKKLLVYTNTKNNIPERGITDLISFMTRNKINIAPATVINSVNEFSYKSRSVLSDIKSEILKSPVINNDETPIKVNGKENSVLGVFTNKLSLLEAHPNRKEEAFIAMNILNIYTGLSVHDHNKMHQKFMLSTQCECNFHVLRYAGEQLEIHGFAGIKEWIEVLIKAKEKTEIARQYAKELIKQGVPEENIPNGLTKKEIEEIEKEYLSALNKWDKEHEEAVGLKNPIYFEKSRCLKKRLREFVNDHLRFLSDFRIPFTNNLAERGLRAIKIKEKIGNFRSLKGAGNYCSARSIIETAIKQKLDVGNVISDIFDGKINVFDFQNINKKEKLNLA